VKRLRQTSPAAAGGLRSPFGVAARAQLREFWLLLARAPKAVKSFARSPTQPTMVHPTIAAPSELESKRLSGPTAFHASAALQQVHDEAPKDHFTLGWLVITLRNRSFGMVMLLLALAAIAPGVSIVAGLLLMIPAFQMIAGHPTPIFPRLIAERPLRTRRLAGLVERAVPILRYLEKVIHPRWSYPLQATKRVVGAIVFLLSATLVFTPIPLTNVVPAVVIALISLAYLEEDGLLLSIGLLVAVIMLSAMSLAVWETIHAAQWLGSLKAI
jgi:hypothetical protein